MRAEGASRMQQRPNLAQRMRTLRKAEQSKWNRFTWSGLLLVALGLGLIAFGIHLNTGADSAEGIALGFGSLIVIAGIIRILIGVINPATPDDLRPYEMQEIEQQQHEGTIDEELFS